MSPAKEAPIRMKGAYKRFSHVLVYDSKVGKLAIFDKDLVRVAEFELTEDHRAIEYLMNEQEIYDEEIHEC